MKAQSIPEIPVSIRLKCKLNPNRFPRMTPLMTAIVGHLLDLRVGNLPIVEMVVTSDGFVLARAEGEVGANHFICDYGDLMRNWFGLLNAAGLTTVERMKAEMLFAAKIGYFGRTTA